MEFGGVGRQVEQLDWFAEVVVQLEVAVAEHAGRAIGAVGVVLGDGDAAAVGRAAVEDVGEDGAVQIGSVRPAAGQVQHRAGEVDQRGESGAAAGVRAAARPR